MNAAVTDLEIVKSKIAKTEAKLEKAEQGGNENLVLMYGNILLNLYQQEQRLENLGIVLH